MVIKQKFSYFQILGLVFCVSILLGCAMENKDRADDLVNSRPRVDEKYRLADDRKKFDELRSQVPEQKKIENDELALLQGLMGELKKQPYEVRDRFDNIMRKKRESFNKDLEKQREKFNSEERKSREVFTKKIENERNDFQRNKKSTEQRKEFFEGIDEQRKNFNADLKLKRDDFESDVREKRRDFEDYTRTKNSEFNQEYRAYSQRWTEYQKQKSNSTASPSSN